MNEIEVLTPEVADNLTALLAKLELGEEVHGVIEPTRGGGYRIKAVNDALTDLESSLKKLLPAGSASAQYSEPLNPDIYQRAFQRANDEFLPYNEVLDMSFRVLNILTDGKVTVKGVTYNIGRPLRKRQNKMPHQVKLEALRAMMRDATANYTKRKELWERQNEVLYAEQKEQLKIGVDAAISADAASLYLRGDSSLYLIGVYDSLNKGLESFEDGWLTEVAGNLGSKQDITDVFVTINRKETEARANMKLATEIAATSKKIIDESQGENYTLTQKQVAEDVIRGENDSLYGIGLQGVLNNLTGRVSRFSETLSNENLLVPGGVTPSTERHTILLDAIKTLVAIERADLTSKTYSTQLERIRTDLSNGIFPSSLPQIDAGEAIDLETLRPYPAAFEFYSTKGPAQSNALEQVRTEFDVATANLRQQAKTYLDNAPSTLGEFNATIRSINLLLTKVDAADGFTEAGLTDREPEDIFQLETHEALTKYAQSLENALPDIPPLDAYIRGRNSIASNLARANTRLERGNFEVPNINLQDPGHYHLLAKISFSQALHQGYTEKISAANAGIDTVARQMQSTYNQACADLRVQAQRYLETEIDSMESLAHLKSQISALQIKAIDAKRYTIPGIVESERPISRGINDKLSYYQRLLRDVESKAIDPAQTTTGNFLLNKLERYVDDALQDLRRGGRHSLYYDVALDMVRHTQSDVRRYRSERTNLMPEDPRVAPLVESLAARKLEDNISPELTEKLQQLLPSGYIRPTSNRDPVP